MTYWAMNSTISRGEGISESDAETPETRLRSWRKIFWQSSTQFEQM